MSAIQQAFLSIRGGSQWTFNSAGSAVTGTSPVVTLPTTHNAGDLLILAMSYAAGTCTSPAGWSVSVNSATGSGRVALFYKIDSGSETSVTVTTSTGARGVMLAYSGINATPLDANGTLATSAGATSLATTSLTTTTANALIVSVAAQAGGVGPTWSAVTGCITRYNSNSSGTAPLCIVDELKTTAGASTARTFTSDQSQAIQTMACSFKV